MTENTGGAGRRRVAILGAGVIGRCLAGFLTDAGHEVTMLVRPGHVADLADGFELISPESRRRIRPEVLSTAEVGADAGATPSRRYDVLFVCVRRDQVDGVVDVAASVPADRVVLMANWPAGLGEILDRLGGDRAVAAFPGFGGYIDSAGRGAGQSGAAPVRYVVIGAQKTTIGARRGAEQTVVDLLGTTALECAVEDDMEGWLQTHTIFIAAIAAAAHHYGGVRALAASRRAVSTMVTAVREGFTALAAQGVTVTPAPLRIIFTRVPRLFAVSYWQRQLAGETGRDSLEPHFAATAATEMPVLLRDARSLVAENSPAPTLDRLLRDASPQPSGHGEPPRPPDV